MKMTREEAIAKLDDLRDEVYNEDSDGYSYAQAIDIAIESLQTDRPNAAYICDGRKCDNDCADCFRTLDIEHARDFKLLGDTYYQQEQADRPKGGQDE